MVAARRASQDRRLAAKQGGPILVDLALQGGGSHGAFTWGVLDRLARRVAAALRRHLRHLGRRDERRGDGLRADAGRTRGRARRARGFWKRVSDAARLSPLRRGPIEILTGNWTLDYSPVFAAVDFAAQVFSPYDTQPAGLESADADPGGQRRLRSPCRRADQAVRHRHQRAYGQRPHLPQRRPHARRAAGLGVPAHDVPGGGDRRRAVLGRRLFRQSVDVAAGPGVLGLGHDPGADQPDRAAGHAAHGARDPEPAERDLLQRDAAEGAERGRPAAAGRRSRHGRGCGVGQDARPPHLERRHAGPRATRRSSSPSGRSS